MGMYGARRLYPDTGPSRTKQSFKESSDINNIVKRFIKTGMIEHVNNRSPVYADVSQFGDFRTALEQVRVTNEFFSGLPAKVRAEFDNDPAVFLDFMADPANTVEATEKGLVPEVKAPPVDEVPGPGIQGRGSDGRFTSPS